MEHLIQKSRTKIHNTNLDFVRGITDEINWEWKLVGLKGARGVGKTTLFLQHIKKNHGLNNSAIYITLDDIYFTSNSLVNFIESARNIGYKYFYIDEVHRYNKWSVEIKNAYDLYNDIYIYFTGSSIIEISKLDGDLSRRALVHEIEGFSFREFLNLTHKKTHPILKLEDLLVNHVQLSYDISLKYEPIIKYFNQYLEYGYYPFFMEGKQWVAQRIEQIIQTIIINDLAFVKDIEPGKSRKMIELLYLIAQNTPFKVNISNLVKKTGLARNTLLNYLYYLEQAQLIHLLHAPNKGMTILQKPEKIYLNNPNIILALSEKPNHGNIRETFFANQLNKKHSVKYHSQTDFLIDDKYAFEIGGKNKNNKQLKGLENAFIAADNIENGINNKIPLWMFGFLS
jgi:uncharacterized protein